MDEEYRKAREILGGPTNEAELIRDIRENEMFRPEKIDDKNIGKTELDREEFMALIEEAIDKCLETIGINNLANGVIYSKMRELRPDAILILSPTVNKIIKHRISLRKKKIFKPKSE